MILPPSLVWFLRKTDLQTRGLRDNEALPCEECDRSRNTHTHTHTHTNTHTHIHTQPLHAIFGDSLNFQTTPRPKSSSTLRCQTNANAPLQCFWHVGARGSAAKGACDFWMRLLREHQTAPARTRTRAFGDPVHHVDSPNPQVSQAGPPNESPKMFF